MAMISQSGGGGSKTSTSTKKTTVLDKLNSNSYGNTGSKTTSTKTTTTSSKPTTSSSSTTKSTSTATKTNTSTGSSAAVNSGGSVYSPTYTAPKTASTTTSGSTSGSTTKSTSTTTPSSSSSSSSVFDAIKASLDTSNAPTTATLASVGNTKTEAESKAKVNTVDTKLDEEFSNSLVDEAIQNGTIKYDENGNLIGTTSGAKSLVDYINEQEAKKSNIDEPTGQQYTALKNSDLTKLLEAQDELGSTEYKVAEAGLGLKDSQASYEGDIAKNLVVNAKTADTGDAVKFDYNTGELLDYKPSYQNTQQLINNANAANDAGKGEDDDGGKEPYVNPDGSYDTDQIISDIYAAMLEKNEAARQAAIDAILANLDNVKAEYKAQIQEVIDEYQNLVNQNEVAKDRARRVIRENQANRGQLDSGMGRQEMLDMNLGYDTITANLKSAQEKAVNEIMRLIAQAESEANSNKAQVNNTYDNAALEYQLASLS